MLTAGIDLLDALRDQLRHTRAGRPAHDYALEQCLNDLVTQGHHLISDAIRPEERHA